MIFGMPTTSFFAFASWPFLWTALAIIVYMKMAKDDVREAQENMEVNEE